MEYLAEINERMVAINDVKTGNIRVKYMVSIPVNFNEVGLLVLNMCHEGKSVSETVETIMERCDLDRNQRDMVETDVFKLLDTLWKAGIIKWKNGVIPHAELFQEKQGEYDLRELTIEDSDMIAKALEAGFLDAMIHYDKNQTDLVEASMLLLKNHYYKISKNDMSLLVQIGVDTQSNQLNLQGLYGSNGSIDMDLLERLLAWVVNRCFKDKTYVRKHFRDIPVYIHTNNEKLIILLQKAGFEKRGTLRKEVKMEDVDFFVKYISIEALD